MKSFERGRNLSNNIRDKHEIRSRSRCSKNENCEKKVEGFAKLSEILAEAQGAIFELIESGRSGLDGKTRLWEIFTYLNNKIWVLIYKPGTYSNDIHLEHQATKTKLAEANMQIQDLKFKLQELDSIEKSQPAKAMQQEIKKYKEGNKKLLDELSDMTKEYLSRENKINELVKANNDLRQEISDVKFLLDERKNENFQLNYRLNQACKENNQLFELRQVALDEIDKKREQTQGVDCEKLESLEQQANYYRIELEKLQQDCLELQDKLENKTKACENLMKENKEFQERRKKKHFKAKSVSRCSSRSSSNLPQGNNIKTKIKSQNLILTKGENVKVMPGCDLKSINLQLKNTIESLKIDKNQLERLLNREKTEKQELSEHLKKNQQDFEDLKSQLILKTQENSNTFKSLSETTEKFNTLSSLFQIQTEKNEQLSDENQKFLQLNKQLSEANSQFSKENTQLSEETKQLSKLNKELEKNSESLKKKLTSLIKVHENCTIEKENWMKLQQDYISQLEDLQNRGRIIIDKDSNSIQKELKCAKSLVIRNQNEIIKLSKEKDMLMHELHHVRQEKFGKISEEGEERVKDLENHIMNLRSLLEVKEKIIKEYGSKQKTPRVQDFVKGSEGKIQELEEKILKFKGSVKEYQENLNKASAELSFVKAEKEKLVARVLELESNGNIRNSCENDVKEFVNNLKVQQEILNLELKGKEEEICRLKEELKLAHLKILNLQEKIELVQEENSELVAEIFEKNKEKVEQEKIFNKVKEESGSQQNEIRVLKSSNFICEQTLNGINSEYESIILEKQELEKRYKEMKKTLVEVSQKLKQSLDQSKMSQLNIEDEQEYTEESEGLKYELNKTIHCLLQEKENLVIELRHLGEKHSEICSLMDKQSKDADLQILEIRNLNEKERKIMIEQLQQSLENNKKITEELQVAKSSHFELKSKVETLAGQVSALINSLTQLQSENMKLQALNRGLEKINCEAMAEHNSIVSTYATKAKEYNESNIILRNEKIILEKEITEYKSKLESLLNKISNKTLDFQIMHQISIEKQPSSEEISSTNPPKLPTTVNENANELNTFKLNSEQFVESPEKFNKNVGSKNLSLKKQSKGTSTEISESQQFLDTKSRSQELLLQDLGITLDQLALKLDILSEEKALLQLDSSEKSSEITRLTKQLALIKIEKQDIVENLSGFCSSRTGQLLDSEIATLEDKFKDYEQEIEVLAAENKFLKMIVEENSEKVKDSLRKCEKLQEFLKKAAGVIQIFLRNSRVYEGKMMMNSEIFQLFKSDQITLASRLEEVKKAIVSNRHSDRTALKENIVKINM